MKIVTSAYGKPANLRIQAMEDNEPAATLSTNIEGVICRPDCW